MMNKLKCIIVDDEPLAVSLLSNYVKKVPFLELVFTSENPLEVLDFIQNNETDLIFLDIQMPELSGINLMEIVGGKLKYILTTAYAEYALEGYEHHIVDYLLKPISFERFYKSALKAQERFEVKTNETENFFFVKASGQHHRIYFDDILFVESIKDYVNIKTLEQEYIVLDTLKSIEQQLPENQFSRIHKSYILNMNQIKNVDSKIATLISGYELPIGESYKMNFLRKLK